MELCTASQQTTDAANKCGFANRRYTTVPSLLYTLGPPSWPPKLDGICGLAQQLLARSVGQSFACRSCAVQQPVSLPQWLDSLQKKSVKFYWKIFATNRECRDARARAAAKKCAMKFCKFCVRARPDCRLDLSRSTLTRCLPTVPTASANNTRSAPPSSDTK